MTRFARRWVCVALLCLPVIASAQDGKVRALDPPPTADTLKRLAQQLQGGDAQLPKDIDPELMRLAADYLKRNPDILNDPQFQQKMKQWQQQAKDDPNGFAKQMKQQNPNLSPEQIDDLKKQFQQSKPNGGFQPPPNITPPMPPDPARPGPPTTTEPQPLPPSPGQQNPFNPSGQGPSSQNLPWQSPEEKVQGKAEYQQAVSLWENNFGDIDNTPALKQSLVDIFSGEGSGGGNGNGNNPWGNNGGGGNSPNKPWFENGNNQNGSQSGLVSWFKNSTSGGTPNWWKNMTNWNQNTAPPPNMGSGWNPPQPSGGGFGSGGGGSFDLSSGVWPVVIFVAVLVAAVGGFVLWRYWPQIQARMNGPKPVGGLGAWTIDPRNVVDRETLVKAFDYLSVLICGDGARVWNHLTIADAFRQNVPGAAPFADPLARLYALARYSPANEPIGPADIAEARGYLCKLAEVPA